MAPIDRLIEQLRRRPPEIDFAVIRQVLEAYDWTAPRETGSHVVFVKQGQFPLSVPKVGGRRVKRTDIVLVLERLGLED